MPSLPPIIFEDEWLVAFAKPNGLRLTPDPRDRARPDLAGLIRARWGEGVAFVQRLDADASGVVLCAKTKPALDRLSGQFQAKTAVRIDEALACASPDGPALPEEFSANFALAPDATAPGRMGVVKRHGQTALTLFRVRARFGAYLWIECRPQTGRKHQVRLHLATSGAPIVNDPLYGTGTPLLLSNLKRGYKGRDAERPLLTHLALHAAALTVAHPATQAPLTLTAPRPREFEVALKYLRKFAAGPGRRDPARWTPPAPAALVPPANPHAAPGEYPG